MPDNRLCKCGAPAARGKYKCNLCRRTSPQQKAENKALNDRRRKQYREDPAYAEEMRLRNKKFFYGLTPEAYQAMIDGQGGRCAICPASEPGGRGSWHVDHDHDCCPGQRTCGQCIRGLLCHLCNVTLGTARDNPAILRAMADYLEVDRG